MISPCLTHIVDSVETAVYVPLSMWGIPLTASEEKTRYKYAAPSLRLSGISVLWL